MRSGAWPSILPVVMPLFKKWYTETRHCGTSAQKASGSSRFFSQPYIWSKTTPLCRYAHTNQEREEGNREVPASREKARLGCSSCR